MSNEVVRILGIDPGLNTTGYGVLEVRPTGPVVLEAGIIQPHPGREKADMAVRLSTLYDGIVEVIEQWKPTVAVVEQLYSHYDHPRTAILMAHARGVLFLACGRSEISVLSYAATRIKKTITGAGRASKEQMQHTIMRELRLTEIPEPHDVSDALAVALCHYYIAFSTGQQPINWDAVEDRP